MELHILYSKGPLDIVLERNCLFRLKKISYLVGDCLFDSLQVLFNSRYTSIELRKGTIEYFRSCPEKQDPEAITSYKHELHKESLIEMHNIHDPEVYLQKMSISASSNLPIETRGLWGDIFCIHWVSNWLKVPIRVWPKTQA